MSQYIWILFIGYSLLCTIQYKTYFIPYFYGFFVIIVILAFHRQKKWQNRVLVKKDELGQGSNSVKNSLKDNWKNINTNINQYFSTHNTQNWYCIFWIFLAWIITYRIYVWLIWFQENQYQLWCGQTRQDIVITWTVLSYKPPQKYTLDTSHGIVQSTIFIQPHYTIGQTLLLEGSIECVKFNNHDAPPFSYPLYQFTHNIVWTVSPKKVTFISSNTLPHISWTSLSSPNIQDNITSFSSKYQWLPSWVLYGVTEQIDPVIYKHFIDSGLVYLIAASGGNISLLIATCSLIFLFLSFRHKNTLWLIATFLYTYSLRTNIALIRAFISYIILLITRNSGKTLLPGRLLTWVTIMCLVYDPYILVSSWWFVLSISGVRGIFYTPTNLNQHRLLRHIAPTVRVFFALLWPLFVLTQRINLITPLVSLPAQFLTVGISYLSLFVVFFGDHFIVVSWILELSIKWLILLATFAANHGIYISLYNTTTAYFLWVIVRLLLYRIYKISKLRSLLVG